MFIVCSAFAYATELSDATLSARAALMGAAMLALMRDIAARSGSASPASASSSSRVIGRNSAMSLSFRRLVWRRAVRAGALLDVRRHDSVDLSPDAQAFGVVGNCFADRLDELHEFRLPCAPDRETNA